MKRHALMGAVILAGLGLGVSPSWSGGGGYHDRMAGAVEEQSVSPRVDSGRTPDLSSEQHMAARMSEESQSPIASSQMDDSPQLTQMPGEIVMVEELTIVMIPQSQHEGFGQESSDFEREFES